MNISRFKANTFVELIMVLVVISIITTISIPRISSSAIFKSHGQGVVGKLVTDVRRTRMMAISSASENPKGYALYVTSTGYQITSVGNPLDTINTANHNIEWPSHVTCHSATFQFGPLGNLLPTSNQQLNIRVGNDSYLITVIPSTGMVTWTRM